ncbi:SGNH/GDSL hydrolase family protein [Sorangium sp. So ce542]|uniref:SGNH/GDSL hydrolase family protein n=1 Tax=Sorangium sp. So ce542 TaxID=3133316 RepID=UPI003F6336A7
MQTRLRRSFSGLAKGRKLQLGPLEDESSLVLGNLNHPAWQASAPTMAFRVKPLSGADAKNLRSLVHVNHDETSPAGSYRERPFACPDGVTAIVVELENVQLAGGDSSTEPFLLQVLDASGITQVSSQSFTPGSAAALVATSPIALTAGAEYRVRLVCNSTGQSSFLCGRLRVRPVSATAEFWLKPFTRLDADPTVLHGNMSPAYPTVATYAKDPRFASHTQLSYLELSTTAAEIYAQYCNTIALVSGNRGQPSIFIDQRPLDPPLQPAGSTTSYVRAALPSQTLARKNVRVFSGPQMSPVYPNMTDNHGNHLCAVYVPSGDDTEVVPVPARRPVVPYGDSKTAGFWSLSAGRDSITFLLRDRGIPVVSFAAGGWTLHAETGSTLSVDACLPLARRLVECLPSKIIVGIGRNDFNSSKFAPSDLITQLNNLLLAIHQVAPWIPVELLSWTREATETDKGGVSWAAMRASFLGLATGKPWVSVLDAARYWTQAEAGSFTSDAVHPNDRGQELISSAIAGDEFPWTPRRLSSLIAYYSAEGRLGGSSLIGAVTAYGTSPPSITVSGTAVMACRVRVEVNTGGTPGGAMKISYSFNAGRQRIRQNVAVPSNGVVELAPLGVSVTFSSATYNNLHAYEFNTCVAQWYDLSGNGNHMVVPAGNNAYSPEFNPSSSAFGKRPALAFTPTRRLRLTGLSLAAPYTLFLVGRCASQASVRAFFGRTEVGSGLVFYANTPTLVAINDETSQINATVNATLPHCYILEVNGASSKIIVDGVSLPLTPNSTLSNKTLTGLSIGSDAVEGWGLDSDVMEAGVCSGVLSQDEIDAIVARARHRYRLP